MNSKALHDLNPLVLFYCVSTKNRKFKYLTGRTEIWQCIIDIAQLIVMPTGSDFRIRVDKSREP